MGKDKEAERIRGGANLAIRLRDENGKTYRWTIRRLPRAINLGARGGEILSGWEYTDHEGYTRYSDGNWLDLVAAFKATASNYGLILLSELS